MRAIVFFVQLILTLLILRIVIRGLAGFFARPGRTVAERGPRTAAARTAVEDLVFDSVCRTYVPRSRALVARIEGRERCFCSQACRDEALAAVARAS